MRFQLLAIALGLGIALLTSNWEHFYQKSTRDNVIIEIVLILAKTILVWITVVILFGLLQLQNFLAQKLAHWDPEPEPVPASWTEVTTSMQRVSKLH